MSVLKYFLISILGLLPTLASAQKACHATLFGTITDAETKAPIAFAEVFLPQTGQGEISDDEGKFAFTELCEGTYTVTCNHIACEHVSKEIQVVGETNLDFQLVHEALNLGEVVVKGKAIALTSTQAERTLSGEVLDAAKGQTMGDLLKTLPGITTLNTGSSIVKPVIRGMHSNRVLMLNNGVRQEGQQWGSEHAPEIDPYIADKVSVVYGANSVRYGADAIGGVVLVEPKALREEEGLGGEANLAGFSNGRIGVASALLDGKLSGKLPLSGRLQGTFKRGGNLRTPDYYLDNTGIQEINYSAALGLHRRGWQSEVFFSQFFTKIGIFKGSHIGNLTDLQNAIDRGRPNSDGSFSFDLNRPLQQVAHYLLKAKSTLNTGTSGKLILQYARQFDRREEFDSHRPYGTLPKDLDKPEMMFEITSHTLDAVWEHKSWRHFTGSVGGQVLLQRNTTDRGGLIPNYESQTAGVFWIERWRKYPLPLELEAGLRYDIRHLDVENRGNEVINRHLLYNNLSGTFGAIYRMGKHFDAKLNFGTAWRAPGVNELFSDGVHHGSASYEIGRDDLVPERAFSTSLTFGFDNQKNFLASLSLYRNVVQDFIYLQPLNKPVLTIRGAFPSFAYEQTNARLSGLDLNAEWKPFSRLTVISSASILRAWNRTTDEWLVLMPSDRFRNGLQWEFGNLGKDVNSEMHPFVNITMMNVPKQKRVPENQDYAPTPAGYTLFDLEAGTSFSLGKNKHETPPKEASKKNKLQVGLNIQNIFNTAYRDYLNRLRYYSDEAGRSISVRLKYIF